MPTNPSAFPREDYQADDAPGQRGMTLRDWFAGQAIIALLPGRYVGADADAQMMAEQIYKFADAMLAERERGQ